MRAHPAEALPALDRRRQEVHVAPDPARVRVPGHQVPGQVAGGQRVRGEPRAEDGVAGGLGLVVVAEHDLAAARAHALGGEDDVGGEAAAVLERDAGAVVRLEVVDDAVAEAHVDAARDGVAEDDVVQLAAVAVDHGAPPAALVGPRLGGDVAAGPVAEVDGAGLVDQRVELRHDARPRGEDARRVLPEADDVPQRLQRGGLLEQHDRVALAVALDRRREPCEAGPYDDDLDARGGVSGERSGGGGRLHGCLFFSLLSLSPLSFSPLYFLFRADPYPVMLVRTTI